VLDSESHGRYQAGDRYVAQSLEQIETEKVTQVTWLVRVHPDSPEAVKIPYELETKPIQGILQNNHDVENCILDLT